MKNEIKCYSFENGKPSAFTLNHHLFKYNFIKKQWWDGFDSSICRAIYLGSDSVDLNDISIRDLVKTIGIENMPNELNTEPELWAVYEKELRSINWKKEQKK